MKEDKPKPGMYVSKLVNIPIPNFDPTFGMVDAMRDSMYRMVFGVDLAVSEENSRRQEAIARRLGGKWHQTDPVGRPEAWVLISGAGEALYFSMLPNGDMEPVPATPATPSPAPTTLHAELCRALGFSGDASREQLLATVKRLWDGRPDVKLSRKFDDLRARYSALLARHNQLETALGAARAELAEESKLSGELLRENEMLRRRNRRTGR